MKRLIIWGTGRTAQEFIENTFNGKIVGFCETNKTAETYRGIKIYSINETLPEYDLIIIANSHTCEIKEICERKKIPLEKVIFLFGMTQIVGYSDFEVIKEIFGEKNWTNYCARIERRDDTFFDADCGRYEQMNTRETFRIRKNCLWPIIGDKYAAAGVIGNYFWQDLWAARRIYKSGIKEHFDIGSRIDGFIAHLLAAGIDVTLIDIREFPAVIENLHMIVDDATNLDQIENGSIGSMSALCSLEHFGLGRYGDPVDPEACFKCFRNIQKKMKQGGNLYISVPVGKERVEFNAHRVFFADTIIKEFSTMKLVEFSCAADGRIEQNVEIHKYDNDEHNGEYRYGLFHFVKA